MKTLDQLQQIIHRKYEGNTSYPSSGEEDYTVRTGLINDAINEWAYQENIHWRELYTTLADASDGDTTADTSTTAYDAPSDFVFMGSFLTITDSTGAKTHYFEKHPDDVKKYQAIDSSMKFFYITGNASSGHKINIVNPIAGTISYTYYKQATELSDTSDKAEMRDPYFIVYSVLAQLYELDNRNDLVSKYNQLAQNSMNAMIIENETLGANVPDKTSDLDFELRGAVIGE